MRARQAQVVEGAIEEGFLEGRSQAESEGIKINGKAKKKRET